MQLHITSFTYPGEMEGSVDLGGWLHIQDGLPVYRQSQIQAVTGPGVEQLRSVH